MLDQKDVNDPSVLKSLLIPLCIHDLAALIREATNPAQQEKLIASSWELVTKQGAFGLPYFHAQINSKERWYFGSDRIGALAEFLQLEFREPIYKLMMVDDIASKL